jgi:hypothetical protein
MDCISVYCFLFLKADIYAKLTRFFLQCTYINSALELLIKKHTQKRSLNYAWHLMGYFLYPASINSRSTYTVTIALAYVLGWRLVQLFHHVNIAPFPIYHWSAKSAIVPTIRKSGPFSQLETRNSSRGQCKTDSGWPECDYMDFDWSKREEIGDRKEEKGERCLEGSCISP